MIGVTPGFVKVRAIMAAPSASPASQRQTLLIYPRLLSQLDMSMSETPLVQKLLTRISTPMAAALTGAMKVAHRRGFSLYLVGGSVRDLLLGRPNLDVDLVVEGDAVALAQDVAATAGARLVTHPRFGTASLRLPAGQAGSPDIRLDLARAREERYERPGVLPSVRPAAIEQDLARRDFTVNAMALSLVGAQARRLLDPHDGQRDLAARRLRVLHGRSFQDDATRILRGLRYEGRLGFRLEPATRRLLGRDLSYVDTISGPRLRHELLAILAEERPERILARAQTLGVLTALHPALSFDRRRAAAFAAARRHALASLAEVYICLLTADAAADQVHGALARLALHGVWERVLSDALRLRGEAPRLAEPGLRPSQVVAILEPFSAAAVAACALMESQATVRGRLWRYLEHWRYRRPALRGRDLQALGVEPGPFMGQVLARLRAARLDGQARKREDEVALVRAWQHSLG
jgi:tRNA nucleotidyltransferase (CCA-adding enzyme)